MTCPAKPVTLRVLGYGVAIVGGVLLSLMITALVFENEKTPPKDFGGASRNAAPQNAVTHIRAAGLMGTPLIPYAPSSVEKNHRIMPCFQAIP
jgi:hypothetical protein